ncbi:laminin subunit gamma [Acrasis kona]|uniref:Laminin subunit gamma n=1 Tax=Acrasis kona TaxID=1008807 RepID=A0AAW2ZEK7_9EUKA
MGEANNAEDKDSSVTALENLSITRTRQTDSALKVHNIRDYIIEAVTLAHQAVQADNEVEPDFEKARRLYRDVAQRLEHVAPFLPEEHAKVLNKFSKIYLERAHALKEGLLKNEESEEEKLMKEYDIPHFPHHKYTMIPQQSTQSLNPSILLTTLPPPNAPVQGAPTEVLGSSPPQTGGFFAPIFTVPFVEEKLQPQGDIQPPQQSIHRPFWLMKTLSLTMIEGGYLTPGLYIPKSVWFQNGAKLFGQQAKINFCCNISNSLQELSKIDKGNKKLLLEQLNKFITHMEREQKELNKQLPSSSANPSGTSQAKDISEKKQELYNANASTSSASKYLSSKMFGFGKSIYKSAMGLVANRTKEDTTEHPYVPWLISIFEHAQFLDNWIVHFEKEPSGDVNERLEKISSFFYFVLCHFVLQDLNILLERYMRKSRESFSRLFPKSYKY